MSKSSERGWTLSVTARRRRRGVNELRRLWRGGGCISLGMDFGVRRTARHSVWPIIFFLSLCADRRGWWLVEGGERAGGGSRL